MPSTTVTLDARDGFGSGVAAVWLEAVGSQPLGAGWVLNETDSGSMTVRLVVSARGETKISFRARDRAWQIEDVKSITVYN
jgi:hypothetical protein